MADLNASSTVGLLALKVVGFQFYSTHGSFFCLESILILIVNPLAVYLIATNRVLNRSSTNVFIVSACIADSMYGISVLFFESTLLPAIKDYSGLYISLGNRISYALAVQSMIGSLLTTMFIAVERGIATFWPLNYKQWVTPRRAAFTVALTWVYLFITVPCLAIMQFLMLPVDSKLDLVNLIEEVFPPLVFRAFISLHLYIPLAVSIVAYTGIARSVYKQTRKTNNATTNTTKEDKTRNQSLKVTKMSMLLMALLLITWTPYAITTIFIKMPDFSTEPEKFKLHKILSGCSLLLVSAYSYLNVIIYAYNHRDFRAVILAKIGKKSNRVFTVPTEVDTATTTT